jgi:hypothetical protein
MPARRRSRHAEFSKHNLSPHPRRFAPCLPRSASSFKACTTARSRVEGRGKRSSRCSNLSSWPTRPACVDMTAEAIARRTTIPLDVIRIGLAALEAADTESRSPAEEGRRIVRLDPARSWGWRLVNHEHYRNLRSKADKAELNRRNYEDRKRRASGTDGEVSTIQTNASELSESQTERSENSDSAHTEAEAEADKSTPDAARTRTHACACARGIGGLWRAREPERLRRARSRHRSRVDDRRERRHGR